MSDIFTCPDCNYAHPIDVLELWSVYEEDGTITEVECSNCEKDLIVTSVIVAWSFDVEMGE